MKKSSEYIAQSVFNVNAHYTQLQNKTKMLFFKCLEENKQVEYFKKEVDKIWGNVNHKFMDKQIDTLQNMVWENNIELGIDKGRLYGEYIPTEKWVINDEYFKLVPESQFNALERDFSKKVVRNYEKSKKSLVGQDKDTYIQKKIKTYNEEVNQTIAYFTKTGDVSRYVQTSTYLSMLHNTNLTRAGWNQTMSDSEKLDIDLYIIPYHPFSCLDCYYYQNRPLTKNEVERLIGGTEEQEGDIIHPNCKCTLTLYWDSTQIQDVRYTTDEVEEQYNIRQKVNSLTLEKSRIATDMKIQKELGNEEQFDKLNQKRNAINSKIRDLKNELPTASLQKQVVAINR